MEVYIFGCGFMPIEMKSIYWDYLEAIDLLVVREVEDKCMRMFLNHGICQYPTTGVPTPTVPRLV